jgi:glycosyltransferase involved in cell wall biosynthesis
MNSKSHKPLVSIVVPVYNAETFVIETIESLLNQSYPEIEIIAVDDGSTDQSFALLQTFKDSIQCIQQSNAGQSAALNSGWTQSRGQYLGYLSADDILHRDCIQKMIEALESEKTWVGAYPAFDLIDTAGTAFSTARGGPFDRKRTITQLNCPVGPGLIFRRAFFDQNGGWDARFRQIPDVDYLIRLSGMGGLGFVEESLAEFRVHSQSQSFAAANEQKANEPVLLIEKLIASHQLPESWFNEAKGFSFLLSARLHIRSGRYNMGFKRLFQALASEPRLLFKIQFGRLLFNSFFGRAKDRLLMLLKKSS